MEKGKGNLSKNYLNIKERKHLQQSLRKANVETYQQIVHECL
jgi:hypothetical protein